MVDRLVQKHTEFEPQEDILKKHEERLESGRMERKIAEVNNKRIMDNRFKISIIRS